MTFPTDELEVSPQQAFEKHTPVEAFATRLIEDVVRVAGARGYVDRYGLIDPRSGAAR